MVVTYDTGTPAVRRVKNVVSAVSAARAVSAAGSVAAVGTASTVGAVRAVSAARSITFILHYSVSTIMAEKSNIQ